MMRWPGIEPGSIAWKATMLTTIPPTLVHDNMWFQLNIKITHFQNHILNVFLIFL